MAAEAASLIKKLERTGPPYDLPYRPKLEPELLPATTVIGKFIDGHSLSLPDIQNFFYDAWPKKGKIRVSRSEDILLVHCSDKQDSQDLINLENIVIMGALLVLKKPDPNISPEEWSFGDTALWVRIYGVPRAHVNRAMAAQFGELLGRTMEVEVREEEPVMRVRVRVDLGRPILAGVYFDAGDYDDENCGMCWVSFRYENVVRFCSLCWRLDHLRLSCPVRLETVRANTVKPPVFRPIKKAQSFLVPNVRDGVKCL